MPLTEEEKKERAKAARQKYNAKTDYAAQKKYNANNQEKVSSRIAEYLKTYTKIINIRFNLGDESGDGKNERDTAIWEHLNKQKNKSGYIKDLIEADMKNTPTD